MEVFLTDHNGAESYQSCKHGGQTFWICFQISIKFLDLKERNTAQTFLVPEYA